MKIYEYEIVDNYIPYPLGKNYSANAAVGNLITNVLANSINRQKDLNFDFLILNSGGFRTTWYPGVIRYAELHSMFPFGNDELYSFKISGRDLRRMLEIVQNGAKKYYATWGLQQTFTKNPEKYLELQKLRHKHLINLW